MVDGRLLQIARGYVDFSDCCRQLSVVTVRPKLNAGLWSGLLRAALKLWILLWSHCYRWVILKFRTKTEDQLMFSTRRSRELTLPFLVSCPQWDYSQMKVSLFNWWSTQMSWMATGHNVKKCTNVNIPFLTPQWQPWNITVVAVHIILMPDTMAHTYDNSFQWTNRNKPIMICSSRGPIVTCFAVAQPVPTYLKSVTSPGAWSVTSL